MAKVTKQGTVTFNFEKRGIPCVHQSEWVGQVTTSEGWFPDLSGLSLGSEWNQAIENAKPTSTGLLGDQFPAEVCLNKRCSIFGVQLSSGPWINFSNDGPIGPGSMFDTETLFGCTVVDFLFTGYNLSTSQTSIDLYYDINYTDGNGQSGTLSVTFTGYIDLGTCMPETMDSSTAFRLLDSPDIGHDGIMSQMPYFSTKLNGVIVEYKVMVPFVWSMDENAESSYKWIRTDSHGGNPAEPNFAPTYDGEVVTGDNVHDCDYQYEYVNYETEPEGVDTSNIVEPIGEIIPADQDSPEIFTRQETFNYETEDSGLDDNNQNTNKMSTKIKSLLYNGSVFAPTTVGAAVTVKFGNPTEGTTDNIMSLDEALSRISSSRQNLIKVVASTDAIDKTAPDAQSYIYLVAQGEGLGENNDVYAEYIVNDLGELEKIGTMELDSRVDTLTITATKEGDVKKINLSDENNVLSSIELGDGIDVENNKVKVDAEWLDGQIHDKLANTELITTDASEANPLKLEDSADIDTAKSLSLDTEKVIGVAEGDNVLEITKDANGYKLNIESKLQLSAGEGNCDYDMASFE